MPKAALHIELKGVREAQRALDRFGRAVRRKHTRIALAAAGGTIRDEARRTAPRETGLLRRSLAVKPGTNKKGDAYTVVGASRKVIEWIEPSRRLYRKQRIKMRLVSKKMLSLLPMSSKMTRRKPSKYLHLVEGGTRKHEIVAKNAKALSDGRTFFGPRTFVSAMPKPFMSMAGKTKGPIATARAIRKLREAAEQEVSKIASNP